MNAPENTRNLIGAGVKRKEDFRFPTGARPVHRRRRLAPAKLRRVPALAVRAREDPQHRYGRRQAGARRDRDLHRRGPRRGQRRRPAVRLADPQHRRQADERAAASRRSRNDKVRHVGDQVALVIAESIKAAKDAAELIEVDYDVLPAVVDTARAQPNPASRLVHDDVPDNVCYNWGHGDKAATDAALRARPRT